MAANRIKGHRVLFVNREGSSRPIVIEGSDHNKYFLKLTGGMSGPLAHVYDWIACRLGAALHLPVPEPVPVLLDGTLDMGPLDIEMKDLVRKSIGLNPAYEYYENAVPCNAQTAPVPAELLHRLFVFDLFLLNIDRSLSNPNLMAVDGRLVSFDYESAFLLMGLTQNRSYFASPLVLKQLRHNPLFSEDITDTTVTRELKLIQAAPIRSIVASLPEEWIRSAEASHPDVVELLAGGLTEAAHNEAQYLDLLHTLHSVPVETEEERKKRLKQNKVKFLANLNRP